MYMTDGIWTTHRSMPFYGNGVQRTYGESLNCRFAIEPRDGFWTLPAGVMENDETVGGAERREIEEEVCVKIELVGPYTLLSVPHVNHVRVFYRARLFDQR